MSLFSAPANIITSESEPSTPDPRPSAHQRGEDGKDLILAALDFLRGVSETGGSPFGSPTLASQKENLRQWADRLGLLLDSEIITPKLTRGGQEHDLVREGERVFKVTRNGVFGLSLTDRANFHRLHRTSSRWYS